MAIGMEKREKKTILKINMIVNEILIEKELYTLKQRC